MNDHDDTCLLLLCLLPLGVVTATAAVCGAVLLWRALV